MRKFVISLILYIGSLTFSLASTVPILTPSSGIPKQHLNEPTVATSLVDGAIGRYIVKSQLNILSDHVTDRKHPYLYPEPTFVHHHTPTPTKFNFTQALTVGNPGGFIGNEPTILIGQANQRDINPYSDIYSLGFKTEDNAKFTLDNWSGQIDFTGVPGVSGSLNIGWSIINGAFQYVTSGADITIAFNGNIDKPTFDFTYKQDFRFQTAQLIVTGLVQTKNPYSDGFGRVIAEGSTSILEDLTVLGNKELIAFAPAPVYDVVHGVVVSLPSSIWLFGSSLIIMATKSVRRNRFTGFRRMLYDARHCQVYRC